MKKIILALALAFLMLAPMQATGDQLADIKAAGKLVVGSDTTYPPFEFIDDNGNPVGFDVDFANELAKRIGVTAEIKTVVWDTIIPQLKAGEFDVIISAMTITEERSQEIDFSIPYYNSSQAILVYKGNPKGIKDENDLDQEGLKIGVQTGTTSDIWVTEHISKADIVRLSAFDELFQKLNLQEIDVILGDLPVVAYAAKTGQANGEVVATFGTPEQFGVGVRKGETNLLNAINDAIKGMLADGTYNQIFETWFGSIGASETAAEEGGFLPFDTTAVVAGFVFVAIAIPVLRKRKR